MAQIINMSVGFMGIQMAFGLQNGNASRILQNLGADVHHLSFFWLVAPITGLLVQPIIGHLSDHTWGKWGRRKPYFLLGALLTAVGLVFLPNSASVTTVMAANVLVLAVAFLALMDASINIAMEPFRALVGDMLPKNQGTLGFSVQTILIGIGAVIGSMLPLWLTKFLKVSNEAADGLVADNVIYSFYIGAFLLVVTIVYTILTTKEYTPAELASFDGEVVENDEKHSFSDIFKDFLNMPQQMKKLGIVQFFSWFALFTMWVYTTSAVATHHYGLSPMDTKSKAFNDAGDYVGYLFGLYNLVSIPVALLVLTPLAKLTSKRFTHFIALTLGGLGFISMYLITDPAYLWISMIGIGFAWASILAMPYAMLIEYLPQRKMGVFMGIFNYFIVLPQIVNGLIGGPIVDKAFNNHAIYYLLFGGVCLIIGGLYVLTIKETSPESKQQ